MNFEQYVPDANSFVKEVALQLGRPEDTDHAYRVMKSVLHAIRDVLSPEESLHMIAQLPMIIKGVYVDGWHIHTQQKIRSLEDFLQSLRSKNERSATRDFGDDETARHHTKCVLNVLKNHVTTGEIQHLIDQFPNELAELWLIEEKDGISR